MTCTRSERKYVHRNLHHNNLAHSLLQIVGFKSGYNVNSNEYGDHKIDLLGEIRTVCITHTSLESTD